MPAPTPSEGVMRRPPRKRRIGEDLEPWEGGSVLGSAWGYVPPGWVMKVCIGCNTDLETWDPAKAGPLLDDDFCRACRGREKCPACSGSGTTPAPTDDRTVRLVCQECGGRGLWPEHLRRRRVL